MPQNDNAIPLEGDESNVRPLDAEPVPLAAEPSGGTATPSKIQTFGRLGGTAGMARKTQFKRAPTLTGAGAVRCRMFHSKVTVAALDHMFSQINEWLDGDDIEVKAVNQVVGVLEGKTAEPNLIVTIWY